MKENEAINNEMKCKHLIQRLSFYSNQIRKKEKWHYIFINSCHSKFVTTGNVKSETDYNLTEVLIFSNQFFDRNRLFQEQAKCQ